MAKRRGRPLLDEASKRGVQISFRASQALRDRLEEARREGEKRSLSEEIDRRLRDSFDLDKKIEERFHGHLNYWLARIIADGIEEIERVTRRRVWEDAYAFDEMRACVERLLQYLRPPGRGSITKELRALTITKAKGEFGKVLAQLFLAHHQTAARGHSFATNDHPHSVRAFAGLPIVTQLARSGKSPLDEAIAAGEADVRAGKVVVIAAPDRVEGVETQRRKT